MSAPIQAWKDDPDYDRTHAHRFALSEAALAPLLRVGDRVLECGAPGSFSAALARNHGVHISNTTGDLRYDLGALSLNHAAYDCVLCMEVFEHIHDREARVPTEWRATGTEFVLRQIFLTLKAGGFLFLTTPNACSMNVLDKVLTMQPPMVYRPHVREYSPSEIDWMLRTHGFAIESFTTHDCWGGGCNASRRRELEALLHRTACPSPHRGEDLFVIARKPPSPPAESQISNPK